MAGLARARPGLRLGLAWFDAHGDFNTPDTTPSGNVWGMPFAMACGRGDADLVAAVDGGPVREIDAALLGGQVLDETESRMLAASGVAHVRAGDARRPGRTRRPRRRGRRSSPPASTAGTSPSTSTRSMPAASYVAGDARARRPRAAQTAVAAVRAIAASGPVLGFGATAAMVRPDLDLAPTLEAIAALAEAAFAGVA